MKYTIVNGYLGGEDEKFKGKCFVHLVIFLVCAEKIVRTLIIALKVMVDWKLTMKQLMLN